MTKFLTKYEIQKLPTKLILAVLYERREGVEYPIDPDGYPTDNAAGEYMAELSGAIADINEGLEPCIALENIGEVIKRRDVDAYYKGRLVKCPDCTNGIVLTIHNTEATCARCSGEGAIDKGRL